MPSTYTALIGQEGDWWIGWIREVPGVNCQGHTREELMNSLETALREYMAGDLVHASVLSSYEQVSIQL